ncbi:MAG TPA: efflux RND transporter periplasmic adaptor subunit [Thermodesulfobacteriota bacterium]|nr:efflux RND transporter periplasmic adaptor subunit [Thermodesulfobacteriota bacterium]
MALSKKVSRPLAVVLIIVVFIVVWRLFFWQKQTAADYIGATGVVEATEVNISPKITGRLSWLCCSEGASLKAGQKAAALDDAELAAKVQEGKADLKGAVESVNEAKASLENAVTRSEAARYEKEAAGAEVQRNETLLKEAGDNLERAKGLIKDGYITQKDMDSAETAYNTAMASLEAAKARKKSADANISNTIAGIKAAKASISFAVAGKEQAEARLKVLETQLADTVIVSPIDGVVVYKAFETGEFVTPGSAIYTVDDMSDVWVRFDLEETELQKIRLGDRVEAAPIGSPEKAFEGKVTEIREAGGFATQRDVTRGRSDIRTFSIKARITKPEGYLKPRMTVEVKVFFGSAPVRTEPVARQ